MAEEKDLLMYKGFPLMRKDSIVYYGSMADSHIVMLQILETEKKGDTDIATKVSVELQLTDPSIRAKDRIVKKERKGRLLHSSGCWLCVAQAGAGCKVSRLR